MLRADFESYAGAWRAARATLRNGLRHAGEPADEARMVRFKVTPWLLTLAVAQMTTGGN